MAITINGNTYTSGYTHAGKFHADDICSAALLRTIDPLFPIVRGFRPPVNDTSVLIFDIGGGEFDHHMEPREVRLSGVQYAAFGKLWRALSSQFGLSELQQTLFDRDICSPIDYADNTGRQNPLSEMLSSFNPCWDEAPELSDSLFFSAVEIARQLIEAWMKKAHAMTRSVEQIEKLKESSADGVMVANSYIPTTGMPDDIDFFICPSQRGGWQALSIRHRDGTQVLFPIEWRGKATLPDGILFCHAAGFIATFDSMEMAQEVCKELVFEYRSKHMDPATQGTEESA